MLQDPRQALDRTLLLMRDEFLLHVTDAQLLDALRSTQVALVIDAANSASHSAQTAYVTAALLMARSAHRVYVVGPDVSLAMRQLPLRHDRMVSALLEAAGRILPQVEFHSSPPRGRLDLEVRFGDTPSKVRARRSIAVSASPWTAYLSEGIGTRWASTFWPFGGLACGPIVAAEAFKLSMTKLAAFARNPGTFKHLMGIARSVTFALAPDDTPTLSDLGEFDMVSAGAIINAALYVLGRVPDASGIGRVIDRDEGDVSNLNRNALFTIDSVRRPKAEVLAQCVPPGLRLDPVIERYDEATARRLDPLAARVLVGVDDIPTRWRVQRGQPAWLGVGATTHWSAMASFHVAGLPCAGCLHPTDDPNDAPVPTVAFVSFWAGLLLSVYYIRSLSSARSEEMLQQTFLTPLRPELPWRTPVQRHRRCPVCGNVRTVL